MKKILLIAFLFFGIISGIKSQNYKSHYLLGFSTNFFGTDLGSDWVNASYSWYDTEKHKISYMKINPRFGYFVTSNLVTGLDLEFSYSSSKFGPTKLSTVLKGIGPFARFYTSTSKRFNPFIEASGTLLTIKSKNHYDYGENEGQEDYFNLFGGMGVSYFIKENLAFEVLGGYAYYIRADKVSGYTYDNLNSLAFRVCISIVLGKKLNK
jgi:hypothetical protein